MAGETTQAQLAGFLKPVFGELQLLVPEESYLQKKVKFETANLVGLEYQEPVQVKTSWGVSYLGSTGAIASFNTPINSVTVQAKIVPFVTVLRDQVSYSMFDRAPEGGGKQAFMAAGAYVGKNLAMQIRRLLEISMLFGQEGVGIVESYTTDTITLTAGSLSPGILSILEGAAIDVFETDLSTARPNCLTTTTGLYVTEVNVDNRTLRLSKTFGSQATPDGTPAATDVIFIHGSLNVGGTFNEMVGLRKQVSVQTGTVFNVDKALYSLMRGNVYSSVGAFSAGALLKGAAKAINRGFQGKMLALVSPRAWNVLNANASSQQMFDSSYSVNKLTQGTDALEIRGQGVVIEVHPHPYQKEGEALLLPEDYLKRIGSVDVSFAIPGADAKFLLPVIGTNAVEMQCRSDQAIYCSRPAWSVHLTGITYS
jgi:hypothetical protein